MPFTCIVLHVEPERVGEKDGKRERERGGEWRPEGALLTHSHRYAATNSSKPPRLVRESPAEQSWSYSWVLNINLRRYFQLCFKLFSVFGCHDIQDMSGSNEMQIFLCWICSRTRNGGILLPTRETRREEKDKHNEEEQIKWEGERERERERERKAVM